MACINAGRSLDTIEDQTNNNLLHAAVIGRDSPCVQLILDQAPYLIFRINAQGFTPDILAESLRQMAIQTQNVADEQIYSNIQTIFSRVIAEQNVPLPNPALAVHHAAYGGTVPAFRLLLQQLPAPNFYSLNPVNQDTILHSAIRGGNLDCVLAILMLNPALVNQMNVNGNTPNDLAHLLSNNGGYHDLIFFSVNEVTMGNGSIAQIVSNL